MQCERCQKETNSAYTFYYGEGTAAWDSQEVFLCDTCVAIAPRREALSIVGKALGLALAAFFFAIILTYGDRGPLILCIGSILVIITVGIILAFRVLTSKDERVRTNSAEKMAINIRKPALKSRGATKYWTSKEYTGAVFGAQQVSPTTAEPKSALQAPDPANQEEYVRRCLEAEFKEEVETRTFQSNPLFATVLTPLNSQQYAQAIQTGQAILPRVRDFDLIYKWLGTAFRGTQQLPKSRLILSEGLNNAKRKSLLLTDMGETEWQLGNINNAIYWWAQAIHCLSSNPVDHNAYLLLSYVAKGAGLTGFERDLLARVDSMRDGQIRLDASTAQRLTALAMNNKTEAMQKALEGLQAKYFSAP